MKLYFLSTKNFDDELIEPRIPDNFFTKNGYEDNKTPRVCLAPSIDKALMALGYNVEGKKFYVHITDVDKKNLYKPSKKDVPDAEISGEMWAIKPVDLTCIGTIIVGKPIDEPQYFYYGNKKESEYMFNWDWDKKYYNENEMKILTNEQQLSSKKRNNLEDNIFGLPEDRKYPLNDREHVIQAIRMFNNVESSKEKELAKNIIKRMKELDIDITIGDKNRLHKYYYNKESLNEFSLFNDKSIMVLSNKKISKVEEKDFGTAKSFLNHAICLYLKYHTSTKCKVKGEDGEDKTVYINKNDEKDFLAEKIYIYKFNKRDFSKGYNYYEAKKDLKCEEPEVVSMKDFLSKHGWKIKYYSKDSKNIIPTAKKIISEKINKLKCKKGFKLSMNKDEIEKFNSGQSDSVAIYHWDLWDYNSNAREFFGTDECEKMYTDIQKAIKDANKELPKGYKFTFGSGDWDEDFIDLERTSSISESTIIDEEKFNNHSYKYEKITNENIDKYKNDFSPLKHCRLDEDYKGQLIINNDKCIGYVNVDTKRHMIQALEIDNDYKKQGLGSRLLSYAVNQLGAKQLTVRKSNKPAINLYKKAGFEIKRMNDFGQYVMVIDKNIDLSKMVDKPIQEALVDSNLIDYPNQLKSNHIDANKTKDKESDECYSGALNDDGSRIKIYNGKDKYERILCVYLGKNIEDYSKVKKDIKDAIEKYEDSSRDYNINLVWGLDRGADNSYFSEDVAKELGFLFIDNKYSYKIEPKKSLEYKAKEYIEATCENNFNILDKRIKLYHSSPINNLKTITPKVARSYSDLGGLVFASPSKAFSSLFGIGLRDDSLKISTINSNNLDKMKIQVKLLNPNADIHKSFSLYEIKNDGSFERLPNKENYKEVVSHNEAKVLSEIEINDWYEYIKTFPEIELEGFDNAILDEGVIFNDFKENHPNGFYGVNNHDPNDNKGIWNSCIWKGNKVFRERAEMCVLTDLDTNDPKVYVCEKKDTRDYTIPGGSTEPGYDLLQTAIKETKEEARMNVKNVKQYDSYTNTKESKWDITPIDNKNIRIIYDGYITTVCVGEYDSVNTDYINPADREEKMAHGKFVSIKKNKNVFYKWHYNAIKKYLKERKNDMKESDIDIPNIVKDLYNKLTKFKYGVLINGRIQGVKSAKEWDDNYKYLSPEEFEKYNGGGCWDFVAYQTSVLEKNNIDFDNYYIEIDDGNNGTHSITVINYNNKLYYLECINKFKGIFEFTNINDLFNFVMKNIGAYKNKEIKYKVYKYNKCDIYGSSVYKFSEWMNINAEFIGEFVCNKNVYTKNILEESTELLNEGLLSKIIDNIKVKFNVLKSSLKDKQKEIEFEADKTTYQKIFDLFIDPEGFDKDIKSNHFVPVTSEDTEYIKVANNFFDKLEKQKPHVKKQSTSIINKFNYDRYKAVGIKDIKGYFGLFLLFKGTSGIEKYSTFIIGVWLRNSKEMITIEAYTKNSPKYKKPTNEQSLLNENSMIVINESAKRQKKFKCPYCEARLVRQKLIDHVSEEHKELIPQDYTPTRVVFNLINKKTVGHCVQCKKETRWNETLKRYDRFCSDKCVQDYRKWRDENMMRTHKKLYLTDDPEHQNKMLAGRRISGEYEAPDGTKRSYVGNYELEGLKSVFEVIGFKPEDIQTPGPTVIYNYDGKEHFWILDMYIVPFNLAIDFKDGGKNPNKRDMPEYRAKQVAKEKAIKDQKEFNYLRLTDNDFSQLLVTLLQIRDSLVDTDMKNSKKVVNIFEYMAMSGCNPVVSGGKEGYIVPCKDKIQNSFVEPVYALDKFLSQMYRIVDGKLVSIDRKGLKKEFKAVPTKLLKISNMTNLGELEEGMEITHEEIYKKITGKELLDMKQYFFDKENFTEVYEGLYEAANKQSFIEATILNNNSDIEIPVVEQELIDNNIKSKFPINIKHDINGYFAENCLNGVRSLPYKSLQDIPEDVINILSVNI